MHTRGARLARGWVVGVFSTAVAALSHVVAGGVTPGWLALVVGSVFGVLLGTFAAGRRPSLPRLVAAVGGSQVAFHSLFSWLGTGAHAAGSTDTGTHAAHAGHAMPELAAATPHHADSLGMWVAHAIAGLVTLAFLRFAERALWSLLTRLGRLVRAPFATTSAVPVPAPRRTPVTSHRPSLLAGRLLLGAASRRGPPLLPAL